MKNKVNAPVLVLALLVLGGILFGIYKYSNQEPPANPGLADIPPKKAGDDTPVVPPAGAGKMPGIMKH